MRGIARQAALIAVAVAGMLVLAGARADERGTYSTLKENIFLCVTPQAYDDAMGRVNGLNGQNIEPLKKELSEKQQCMFVDAEMVDNIMAPFAIVLQREGTKVQVQFVITFRKRVEFLHRLVNRFVLVGWTEQSNLEPKTVL